MHSKMNELEEAALVESGRARIAGTRTKMELAWQKERESQKKLISELNTMSRDLKATLLEVEKEKDREKLESRRKMDTMKGAFEEEQASDVVIVLRCSTAPPEDGPSGQAMRARNESNHNCPTYLSFRKTRSDKSPTCSMTSWSCATPTPS